ncbi:hypothetical protein AX16_008824 [Volvariella volvacea WC 439]|nr:hypothetical protein AX16_008824 [Volvariella volvacea WC 439]
MDFFGNGGPGGLLQQFGGFPAGYGPRVGRSSPRSYDEYLKAYSVAMMAGRQRDNVSYGGKVIMPPSALANLTQLDLDQPWVFELRNPKNPAASTHAGVLEFIAPEGIVYLPYWMMKTLRLEEGDTIRITGTDLPKGKFVKLQAQTVHFLEIHDPKAVLEQELRNFSALTQGDIIEISYNTIVFGLLVMETQPGGGGISVQDTDLEVDFAPPVGYVEPERPKPPPPPTMASRLGIDVEASTPGSSRPGSSLGGGFKAAGAGQVTVSKGGEHWESFKGKGETLAGRKTKGKGISHRKAEEVDPQSKIHRTENHRIVSNSTYENDMKVPPALNLPFGQLFFGFKVKEYASVGGSESPSPPGESGPFLGAGQTLTGRGTAPQSKGKERADKPSTHSWTGQGQTLGSRSTTINRTGPVGVGGALIPQVPKRQPKKERSPTPDFGVDDDDDIPIDSD